MNKILNLKQAIKISKQLKSQGKTIVLVGGCFDIVHLGHIRFLNNAKKYGDILIVLLENDSSIKALKGPQRPFNTQKERAEVLCALSSVDYVVLLPLLENNEYDAIICSIHPNTIGTTKGDPNRNHKERQAKQINAEVIDVIERIVTYSTTALSRLLPQNL